jgi:hypothetical protein
VRSRSARIPAAHLEVLLHTHARKDAPAFGRLADAHLHDAVRRHAIDALSIEQHFAVARPDDARDGAQRGRLAGTVGANQGDNLTGHDAQ